jgi:hypothetical protein
MDGCQYWVVLFLWLTMARPSKCAGITDMVIERGLDIDSEEEISIDEYDNLTRH